MALQGTLETFELGDVLQLLASSAKTGRLRLSGDRGTGYVWVEDGRVVGVDIDVEDVRVENEADALFHLLRFEVGSYVFELDEAPAMPLDNPVPMDLVLADAEARLAEWTQITAVVPHRDAWVSLRPELDGDDVLIDAPAWSRLAIVGSGLTVREMGDRLGEAELVTMRAVKELVGRGLVDIVDTPVPPAPEPAPDREWAGFDAVPEADVVVATGDAAPEFDPVGAAQAHETVPPVVEQDSGTGSTDEPSLYPIVDDEAGTDTAVGDIDSGFYVAAPVGEATALPAERDATVEDLDEEPMAEVAAGVTDDAVTWGGSASGALGYDEATLDEASETLGWMDGQSVDTGEFWADEHENVATSASDLPPPPPPLSQAATDEASEMARQLASLTPAAARAVARAARADTMEEREAALAEAEAEDDSVDRGLLLRFLGSLEQ